MPERVLGYWDQLQLCIDRCQLLQRCPIPNDDAQCAVLGARLDDAAHELRMMLHLVAPYTEVWSGVADDPLREGRVLASDFNRLAY